MNNTTMHDSNTRIRDRARESQERSLARRAEAHTTRRMKIDRIIIGCIILIFIGAFFGATIIRGLF